jgi:hypothetical protein
MNNDANVQKYVQFPLCWLQEIALKPKDSIDKVISYGMMRYATKKEYSLIDVARQVYYDWLHNNLDSDLDNKLCRLEQQDKLIKDTDYNGFSNGAFDCEYINDLESLLKDDSELKKDCIIHYQLHLARQHLNIKGGNLEIIKQEYNKVTTHLNKHEQMNGKQPFPSIGLSLLFSFRNNPENIELLLAYVSIKSLIGRNEFGITTKDAIIMRMIGAKNKEALQEACKNNILNNIYNTYIKRYRIDKLLDTLQLKGFIKSKIGMFRRIYISTQLDYQQLEAAIINHRNSIDIKKKEKEAKNRILQHLYNNNK